MNAQERVKKAGFRKFQNENAEDCCLFCNYYHLSSDKTVASCKLHEVTFWSSFEASDHVCNRFNGDMLQSLFEDIANENLESSKNINIKKQNSQSSKKKEGCYIATAVYGDYDAPEVLVLREFRDKVLKKTKLGCLFIKIYYVISPKLACKLKTNEFINGKIKLLLDRMVLLLGNRMK